MDPSCKPSAQRSGNYLNFTSSAYAWVHKVPTSPRNRCQSDRIGISPLAPSKRWLGATNFLHQQDIEADRAAEPPDWQEGLIITWAMKKWFIYLYLITDHKPPLQISGRWPTRQIISHISTTTWSTKILKKTRRQSPITNNTAHQDNFVIVRLLFNKCVFLHKWLGKRTYTLKME